MHRPMRGNRSRHPSGLGRPSAALTLSASSTCCVRRFPLAGPFAV